MEQFSVDKPVPYIGDLPYVFASYSHRNTGIVWDTLTCLQKDGFRFWYDDGIVPGVSWDDYIADHINRSGYFIAFISAEYAESDNCIQELRYAIESKKPVLLVRLDRQRMTPGLEMRVCTYQSINYFEIDDAEYIEHIETAEGISLFQAKREERAKRSAYKESCSKLIRVLKQSYYCEALFLEHEQLDDLLFWCIYSLGLVAEPASSRLRDTVRPVLKEILNDASDEGCRFSMCIGTTEQKLRLLNSLLQWANSADIKVYGTGFDILRKQLITDKTDEYMSLFAEIENWLTEYKSTVMNMLKRNPGSESKETARLASSGYQLGKALNGLYREIRKGNSVRKAFKLKK